MFHTFRFMGGSFIALQTTAHWKVVGSNGEYYGVFKSIKDFKRGGNLPPVLCQTRLVTELIEGIHNEETLPDEC